MRIDISYHRTDWDSADFVGLAVLAGAAVGAGVMALWQRFRRKYPAKEVPHGTPAQ